MVKITSITNIYSLRENNSFLSFKMDSLWEHMIDVI